MLGSLGSFNFQNEEIEAIDESNYLITFRRGKNKTRSLFCLVEISESFGSLNFSIEASNESSRIKFVIFKQFLMFQLFNLYQLNNQI